ncbi:hypothetical protein [Methanoregula sp.]|uniref:hypothetical protein n=1 Tax=Methanoregula sp. TaxID=2052170 RepID=UPI0035670655
MSAQPIPARGVSRMHLCKAAAGCCFIVLLMVIPPVAATPYARIIGGQVTGLNETSHTLTIVTDCDRFPCDEDMQGSYSGIVRNDSVFGLLRTGEPVVLMYRSWMGQYPCKSGDYEGRCMDPGHEPIPVGNWEGISRVTMDPVAGRWLTTDLFGDPHESTVQLVNNYSLDYEPGPDSTACPPDQPLWECNAGYLNVTLSHRNTAVAETRILRNTTFMYEDPVDRTTVTILFRGGRATPRHVVSPGGCPCTDIEVHARPIPVMPVQASPPLPPNPLRSATQAASLPFGISLIAPFLAGILVLERIRKM